MNRIKKYNLFRYTAPINENELISIIIFYYY